MRPMVLRVALTLPLALACRASQPAVPATPAPDAGKRLVATTGMVTSAHPAASEAGVAMLRQGGNAIDAAVATAFTLGVGEPQMSGLGGGGALLVWLQREGRAEYLDFYPAQRVASWRGVAPLDSGVPSLRVVGIPGEVAGLLEAHERFGRLSRATVLAPAIRLAEDGFPVNQVLADMIASSRVKLERFPASRRLFFPNGEPLRPGDVFRNPELAALLRRIATEGRAAFYEGDVAREVVRVLNDGKHPATMADLAAYRPQWKRPLCTDYRQHVVLTAPPPQTGVQLAHTLNLLESHDLRSLGYATQSERAFDVLASAIRVANTDSRVNSDPNWSTVPAAGVVAKEFAAGRAPLVGTGRAEARFAQSNALPYDSASPSARCAPLEPYGPAVRTRAAVSPPGSDTAGADAGETTHLSVVDADGNAVALTRTNSSVFGIGASASGFLLNDSGADLSRVPAAADSMGRHPWRIRNSTIAPTIVLRDGRVQLVIGAPGGGRIQAAILQTLVYVLDHGLDPLEAVRMPRIYPTAGSVGIETENGFNATVLGRVRQMGYVPTPDASGYARVYVIARNGNRWIGAADPRHNGAVIGY